MSIIMAVMAQITCHGCKLVQHRELEIIFAPLAPESNSINHEKTFISICRIYYSFNIM